MKTNINTIATFAAATILSDGFYDETEKDILKEVAEVYHVCDNELIEIVDSEIEKMKSMSEDEITLELKAQGKDVPEEEKGILFECVLELVLADGKLAFGEISNLLAIAEVLGMKEETAVLLIADIIKEEPEIKVEL